MKLQDDSDWRLISAKYESRCLFCEGHVEIGEPVWWLPETGVRHERCGKPLPPVKRNLCERCWISTPVTLLQDGICVDCRD